MARLSNPIEIQRLKGADKKNPQRYKSEIPKSGNPLGDAPAHMNEAAQAAWFELQEYAVPGVMTAAERPMMELLCNLFAEYRANPPDFPAAKMGHLVSCLARFGMSPSDRTKLGVDKDKADNPFARLDD